MTAVVDLLNQFLGTVFSLLLAPFRGLHPAWGVAFVSLLTGLLMLWIYARVSNQAAIRLKKNEVQGNLLGVRLYQHDIRVVMAVQRKILRLTLTYMKYSLVPMLFILPPVLLILTQLNLHFDLQPIKPGERTLLEARLSSASLLDKPVELVVPEGVVVETPGVRIPSLSSVTWRIRIDQPGRHKVLLKRDGETIEKELVAGSGWDAISRLRTKGVLDLFLYPGERPLKADSFFDSVTVTYPPLASTLGLPDWLVLFFVLSMVFSFGLKGVMGVEL